MARRVVDRYDSDEDDLTFDSPGESVGRAPDPAPVPVPEPQAPPAQSAPMPPVATPGPSNIPEAWRQDFLARNPLDVARMASAYESDRVPGPDSGGGFDPSSFLPGLFQQIFGQQQAQQAAFAQQQQAFQSLIAQQQQRMQAEAAARAALEEQVRNSLMAILGQGVPTAEGVAGSQEARGFQRMQERAQQMLRAQAAERTGRRGTGVSEQGDVGGGLASAIGGSEQQLAENVAAQQGELYSRELQARRTQLMHALSQGAGILAEGDRQQIQSELAGIEAQLQQQQNALGQANLGTQTNMGLLNALLQNEQFFSGLGANVGYQQALLNQNPFQFLFG